MGLDIAEMVMEIEDRFGIQIADDEGISLKTAGELRDYVIAQLKRRGQVNEEDVWLKLVEIIRRTLQRPKLEIRPESRFFEDLGMG